jgi:hypothetical protein
VGAAEGKGHETNLLNQRIAVKKLVYCPRVRPEFVPEFVPEFGRRRAMRIDLRRYERVRQRVLRSIAAVGISLVLVVTGIGTFSETLRNDGSSEVGIYPILWTAVQVFVFLICIFALVDMALRAVLFRREKADREGPDGGRDQV